MRSLWSDRTPRRDDGPIGVTVLRPRPEFDRLFDALADPERLRLLEQLEPLSSTAGKLAPRLEWTRDEVAKQLKLLERAGLVHGERLGRQVEYARSSPVLMAALGWASDLWVRLRKAELTAAEVLGEDRQVALAAALRTPGRRDMLECMSLGGPITQGAAAQDCGLSQGLASRGLAQLVDVGLVTVRPTAPPHRYAASPETMAAVVLWLKTSAGVAKAAEAQQRRFKEARAARADARTTQG